MYHNNIIPSEQYSAHRPHRNMYSNAQSVHNAEDYLRSPNVVTAAPSPTSPRIKIANVNAEQRRFDNSHEVDIQELEAEADYREYVMYQRIMQHRSSRPSSLVSTSMLLPPTLPLSSTYDQNRSLLPPSMIQRLRDNAKDHQESVFNNSDHVEVESNNNENEDDYEPEVGIFELDM